MFLESVTIVFNSSVLKRLVNNVNAKYTTKFVNTISCVGTIYSLYQAVCGIKHQKYSEILFSLAFTIAFIILLLLFNYNKKKYVDLYAVCSSMSLNNRLQTLREIILIMHRQSIGNDNKHKIDNAKFTFVISPSQISADAYDIHYVICLDLHKPCFLCNNTIKRTFRFFIITLATAPQHFISKITANNDEMTVYSSQKEYTIRGESGSKEKAYSGLYEIVTVIPSKMIKRKGRQIQLQYTYDVLGQIKKAQDKHSFTIIPRNFGVKIKKIEIYIQTKNMQVSNLELQRYGNDEKFEIAELFIPYKPFCLLSNISEGSSSKVLENSYGYYTSMYPNIHSAYSVQFDLPKDTTSKKLQ